jgi:hypothetical protein
VLPAARRRADQDFRSRPGGGFQRTMTHPAVGPRRKKAAAPNRNPGYTARS